MEKNILEVLVHIDIPDGEAPGIPIGDTSKNKIRKALNIVITPGLDEYGFTAVEMDMADDNLIGIVLTHEDA